MKSKIETLAENNINLERRAILKALVGVGGSVVTPSLIALEREDFSLRREKILQERLKFESAVYFDYNSIPINKNKKDSPTINLVGVAHTPETIIQYLKEIEDKIKASSVIVLEYFDIPKTSDLTAEITEKIVNYNDNLKEVIQYFKDKSESEAFFFFSIVAGIAFRYGKDVVVVNPESIGLYSSANTFSNKLILNKLEYILSLGNSAFFAFLSYFLNDKIQKQSSIDFKDSNINRRRFLRTASRFISIGSLAYGAINKDEKLTDFPEFIEDLISGLIFKLEKGGIIGKKDSKEVKLGKLRWCIIDWRDVSTALGLLKMEENDRIGKNISGGAYFKSRNSGLLIQGFAHEKVLAYLKDPEAAKKRMQYYNATFNLVGNLNIRRYRYDKESKRIVLISKQSY